MTIVKRVLYETVPALCISRRIQKDMPTTMATLKLFDPNPANADGSHRVAAPGGYESWYFHVHDPSQNIRAIFGFHHGYFLHPDYVRHFAAYRRWPTHHAPPVPSQYPCLTVAVYEDLKALATSTIQYPAGSLQATDNSIRLDQNTVKLCPNQIDAEISLKAISARFSLRPIFALATEKVFPPPQPNGFEHHWRFAAPICEARGEIHLGSRTIAFEGLGQYNHYYGSGPPGSSADRWIRGQILFPRAAVNFQTADNRAIVITADESGLRQIDDSAMTATWNGRSSASIPYASSIDFGRWLMLRNPRIAARSPASLQLVYDAYVDGQQSAAWVELDYPNYLHGFFRAWQAKRHITASAPARE
jgi:hypothetical protein